MHPLVRRILLDGEPYRVRTEPDGRRFIGDKSVEQHDEMQTLRGRPTVNDPPRTAWQAHQARRRAR